MLKPAAIDKNKKTGTMPPSLALEILAFQKFTT